MPSASSSVAQFNVSPSQLLKHIKSVNSLVLKKEVTAIVCIFYEKRRLKRRKVTTIVSVFLRKAPTKNAETVRFYLTLNTLEINL